MADSRVQLIFRILVEGAETARAAAEAIRKVDHATKQNQQSTQALGSSVRNLGRDLAGFVGVGVLTNVIKTAVVETAALDRRFAAIGFAMQKLKVTGGDSLDSVRAKLEALEASGGAALTESTAAFQKFIGITKDTTAALAAVRLASDLAETGQMEMAAAVEGVTALLQGRGKAAANSFGIELLHVNGQVKTNAELLDEAWEKYEGFGGAVDDADEALSRMKGTWASTLRTVGQGFSIVLKPVEWLLFHGVAVVKDLGAAFGFVFNFVAEGAVNLKNVLAAAFDLKALLSSPAQYGMAVNAAFDRLKQSAKDALETLADQMVENHQRDLAYTAVTEGEKAKLREQSLRTSLGKEDKAEAEAAARKLKAENDLAISVEQARLDATTQGTQARYKAELALLAAQEKAAVDAAQAEGAQAAAVQDAFAIKRATLEKARTLEISQARMQAEDALLQARLEAVTQGSDEEFAMRLEMLARAHEAELATFKGTLEDRKLLDQAYLVTRAMLYRQRGLEDDQAAVDAYWGQVQARLAMDATAADLNLQAAVQRGEGIAEAQKAVNDAARDQEINDEDAKLRAIYDLYAEGSAEREVAEENHQRALSLIRQRYAQKDVEITQQAGVFKTKAGQQVFNASVAFAQAAFGQSKAFAAAKIIVDTALAVMAIQKEWAWNPLVANVLSGLVIATAAIQTAKVRGATVSAGAGGAGFDDPQNDAVAELGGRKWARDLVQKVSEGFNAGLKEAARRPESGPVARVGGQSIGDATGQPGAPSPQERPSASAEPASSAPTFVFNAPIYGGDAGLRQLSRELTRAARLDSARLVGGS